MDEYIDYVGQNLDGSSHRNEPPSSELYMSLYLVADYGRSHVEEDNELATTGTEGDIEAMYEAIRGCISRMSVGKRHRYHRPLRFWRRC